jgi:hypothetical protein
MYDVFFYSRFFLPGVFILVETASTKSWNGTSFKNSANKPENISAGLGI